MRLIGSASLENSEYRERERQKVDVIWGWNLRYRISLWLHRAKLVKAQANLHEFCAVKGALR